MDFFFKKRQFHRLDFVDFKILGELLKCFIFSFTLDFPGLAHPQIPRKLVSHKI